METTDLREVTLASRAVHEGVPHAGFHLQRVVGPQQFDARWGTAWGAYRVETLGAAHESVSIHKGVSSVHGGIARVRQDHLVDELSVLIVDVLSLVSHLSLSPFVDRQTLGHARGVCGRKVGPAAGIGSTGCTPRDPSLGWDQRIPRCGRV